MGHRHGSGEAEEEAVSLADTVRAGVALAHQITRDGKLQETVSLKRWRSDSQTGVRTYATALSITAIVVRKRRDFRTPAGEDIISTAQVTFLQPIPPLSPAVTGRKEPVDERDEIVLADGVVGSVVSTDFGLTDPKTNRGYVGTVYLGTPEFGA